MLDLLGESPSLRVSQPQPPSPSLGWHPQDPWTPQPPLRSPLPRGLYVLGGRPTLDRTHRPLSQLGRDTGWQGLGSRQGLGARRAG